MWTRSMIAAAAAAALARGAAAQPPATDESRAAELYGEGKRHFDIAEYTAAIASWKEAYLISSAPLLLFNIGQAYRLSGDCGQANRFYLNYRRAAPDAPNQAELDKAMEKCAGVEPATADTSSAPPDPVEPQRADPVAPPPVAPAVERTDAPMRDGGTMRDGGMTRDDGTTLRIAGIVVAGGGVVFGVAAAVYALRARDKERTVESQAAGTTWSPALTETERAGRSAQTRARVFGVLGAAAVITGGVLWWLGHRRSNTRIDVDVARGGEAEVSLICAF